jgi:small nuclear ribonucleoprotein (snRNP)-like protein
MAVMAEMGQQLTQDFQGKKIMVRLTNGEDIKGVLFTAQDDYLQVDTADTNRRVTIPFFAVLTIAGM